MARAPRSEGLKRSPAARNYDRGVTFVELLVSIVLIGIVVTAVLTALNVSIRGSDQHKSKVSAMAELEGAAAHLNRIFSSSNPLDCPGPADEAAVLSAIETELANSYTTGQPLESPNEGVTVHATTVSCASGIALTTLEATHEKDNATETLDVTVGGITVLRDGQMGTGSAAACTWTGVNSAPNNPQRKSSGRLDTDVTVTLSYVGDCTAQTVALTVTNPPGPPTGTVSMTLNGDSSIGEFVLVFTKNYYSPWSTGPLNFQIQASPSGATFPGSFTVL